MYSPQITSFKTAALICSILLLQLLSSCVKSNTTAPSVTTPAAIVTVIQASPDEPAVNFLFNGIVTGQNGLLYGQGIDYFAITPAALTASFATYKTDSTLVSVSETFAVNNAYSLFLDNKATSPGILLLTDTLVSPAKGNASVRFVDLSPDAPTANLVIQGGKTLVTNRSFQGYSSFLPISGSASYTFNIVNASTGAVLTSLSNVTLTDGSVYSILFEGLSASTNSTDGLKAILLTNAIFN
jgi:hypothetical protein